MPRLQQRMRHRFQQYRDQFPEAWHSLLYGLDPAYGAIRPTIQIDETECIYPREPFRAFVSLSPEQVRVVLFGEDPYPDPCLATGRAFEPGDLLQWQDAGVHSPRRLAQQLADFRQPGRSYAERQGGWGCLKQALTASPPRLQLPTPGTTFDCWEAQGVLFLNTTLTASENHIARNDHDRRQHRNAHRLFWAPLVQGICRRLAEFEQATVFLCWGRAARDFVKNAGIITSTVCPFPVDPCCPSTKALVRDHPTLPSFLDRPNVFREANNALADLMADEIRW